MQNQGIQEAQDVVFEDMKYEEYILHYLYSKTLLQTKFFFGIIFGTFIGAFTIIYKTTFITSV